MQQLIGRVLVNPPLSISYYRLQQMDVDGKTTLSKIIPVELKRANTEFKVYPNPTNANLNIQFQSKKRKSLILNWLIRSVKSFIATN
jgi:hypothetical protein